MTKESKYCSDVMKEIILAKKFWWLKNDEDFESTKCWIQESDYVDDHCLIIGKYRASAYKDCNINVKLNRKVLFVFDNTNSDLIIKKLGKFNLKISVLPNR